MATAAKGLERASSLYVSMRVLRHFIGISQLKAIVELSAGEEGDFFVEKMSEYARRIIAMPATYETQGEPVAYLHYFIGGCDWYISEKDVNGSVGQLQAFGSANLGYGAELGYISLPEILKAGAELDLHFSPRPLAEVA